MGKLDRKTWDAVRLRKQLLSWYERNQRDLPWRRNRDPYAIWVSEIMLQQTRVAVVVERYRDFTARFATVASLAEAAEQEVLALWSGLGYYRRARMLHQAAKFVAESLGGTVPDTAEGLRSLPGIGAYTAAAIASIAHGEGVAVVDGNVERVLCRLAGWDASQRQGGTERRRKIEELAGHLLDQKRPGDFNQAMMELGAMICTPRSPQCLVCPWMESCKTRGEHKTAPRPRMERRDIAHALAVRTNTGRHEVLLEQRGASLSVMPGMWELPTLAKALPKESSHLTVRHAIMQVNYQVRIGEIAESDVDELTVPSGERRWVPVDETAQMALTGLTRKVLTRAHLLRARGTAAVVRKLNAPG